MAGACDHRRPPYNRTTLILSKGADFTEMLTPDIYHSGFERYILFVLLFAHGINMYLLF